MGPSSLLYFRFYCPCTNNINKNLGFLFDPPLQIVLPCRSQMLGFLAEGLAPEEQDVDLEEQSTVVAHAPSYFEAKGEAPFVGLDNQGATCYLNSLLQCLFMTSSFRNSLNELSDEEIGMDTYLTYQAQNKGDKESEELSGSGMARILIELRFLFGCLETLNQRSIGTEELTKAFGWSRGGRQGAVQQDIHELNRLLMDVLQYNFQKTRHKHVIPSLYRGTQINFTTCTKCCHSR